LCKSIRVSIFNLIIPALIASSILFWTISVSHGQYAPISSSCINYDPSLRTITVSCGSAGLTDIDNELHDNNVLTKLSPDGVWLLRANLVIAKGATFHINSNDTRWLRISSEAVNGQTSTPISNNIDVHGSLKIDSVKITSWNPATNNYAITNGSRQEGTRWIQWSDSKWLFNSPWCP